MSFIKKLLIVFLSLCISVSGINIHVSAETKEYYTSNYSENAYITISGDAILHVDVDRTLSYITVNNGSLTITGDSVLTVKNTSSNNNARVIYFSINCCCRYYCIC